MTAEDAVVYPCYTLNCISTAQNSEYVNALDKLVAGQTNPQDFVKEFSEIKAK